MCKETIKESSYNLKFVPDYLKNQVMCERAVEDDPSSLQYVLDWFVTREGVNMWYDGSEYCDDDFF